MFQDDEVDNNVMMMVKKYQKELSTIQCKQGVNSHTKQQWQHALQIQIALPCYYNSYMPMACNSDAKYSWEYLK